MKGVIVGKRNFEVTKMHGTAIKKLRSNWLTKCYIINKIPSLFLIQFRPISDWLALLDLATL